MHKTKAVFLYSFYTLNRKLFPCQFPRALQTLLTPLRPWLQMMLKVASDILHALNMWFMNKMRVSIVDSEEDTCCGMWEYKQISLQSVPSFHCSLKGSSHQSSEGHSIGISMQGSPLGWVSLISIRRCISTRPHFVPWEATLWITSL